MAEYAVPKKWQKNRWDQLGDYTLELNLADFYIRDLGEKGWDSLFTYADFGGPNFAAGTQLVDVQIGFLEWFIKMAHRDIKVAEGIIDELKKERSKE